MVNKRNKILIAILVIIIILVAGYLIYSAISPKGTDQKFRLAKVERGDIAFVVTATGTINPVITVLVGSQVSGTIKALYADYNSRVKEGQVIAQIDPAIFEAQVEQGRASVLSAQANLLNAQSNLENAKANLIKAEVTVSDTKRTLDRNKPLLERNVIAQATLDTAQVNYDTAVAQRDVARAQVESAKSQVESSKAQIAQAKASLKVAETNLRYTTIRSPVNGTVISRNVDVGQTVAASLQAPTLFTIAKDLTQMQVDTNVSEADVGRIEVGQGAIFTVDAYPEKTFHGKVSEIRNAPITVQNVVTYDVVIQVDNKDLKLKPGMTANVSVQIEHKEGVLRIPNAALRFRPEFAKAAASNGIVKKNEGFQKREATAERGTSGQQGRILVERLTEGLSLTPEQKSKVEMILKSSRQEIQEIREKLKPEEATKKIQSLLRQKIMGVLTEEQRRKYIEMVTSSSQEEQGSPGRVWVLSSEKKPVPISIVLGITDGSFSEVKSGELKEGMEVIIEEISNKKGPTKSGSPSFMGTPRR
ncbi:MAG: efflux RND transporter periplasmic adaptor subunit [Syntrophaceae bacterium]|nr:efflux RND transporter periplasmic adaptor subunit [Syntrophaceae bacterium]